MHFFIFFTLAVKLCTVTQVSSVAEAPESETAFADLIN